MALIDKNSTVQLEIPNEPGKWVKIRPLTARAAADVEDAGAGGSLAVGIELLVKSLVEWSYDAPCDKENIENLDMDTFQWLMTKVNLTSGRRPDAEKKASSAGLQRPSRARSEASLQPSAT